jgi:hypothetical protein
MHQLEKREKGKEEEETCYVYSYRDSLWAFRPHPGQQQQPKNKKKNLFFFFFSFFPF